MDELDHLTDDQLTADAIRLHRELFYIEEDYRGSLTYKVKIDQLHAVEDALQMRKKGQRQ